MLGDVFGVSLARPGTSDRTLGPAEDAKVRRTLAIAVVGLSAVLGAAPSAFAGGMVTFGGSDAPGGFGMSDPGMGFLKITGQVAPVATSSSQPYRFGNSLVPAIEPYASVRPWLGTERTATRNSFGVGGVLVDVPLGNFVFTPSFGGGRYSETDGRAQINAIQYRSSLALGYHFDDQSHLSLDYSHTSTTAQTLGGPVNGNALSFTYRIPASKLFGQ